MAKLDPFIHALVRIQTQADGYLRHCIYNGFAEACLRQISNLASEALAIKERD